MGKFVFYIQTRKNLGGHGRGGGQVTSADKLTEGNWHTLTASKSRDQVCLGVSGQDTVCASRTIDAADFQMKDVDEVNYGTGMETRNFQQLCLQRPTAEVHQSYGNPL